ncbi:hypothetical protein EB796_024840 [Bugula neritina]|nr:hypothetical protein EB796_024840 [Bugula neritina]
MANINGDISFVNGAHVVRATITGGNPPPSIFEWNIQQPDGTFRQFNAGNGPTTLSRNGNNNGFFSNNQIVTTARISKPAQRDRLVTLNVGGRTADGRTWSTRRSWTINAQ